MKIFMNKFIVFMKNLTVYHYFRNSYCFTSNITKIFYYEQFRIQQSRKRSR